MTQTRNHSIDLRSDTVTRPDPAMRLAMSNAAVGDDVYGDDPTVLEIEKQFAAILGKDTAIFFPSGTQSNLSAILAHCGRGDEFLVGRRYHTFQSEAGGASVLGGIACNPLPVEEDGSLDPEVIAAAIRPDDPHHSRSRLLCLENTVGGVAIPVPRLAAASDVARSHGLAVHLDGARLFNAAIALDVSPASIAEIADTVSVCLSKGLGCPAGTMLATRRDLEHSIRRNRKILGGSMRQTGILAAAGLHALQHNIERLGQDHGRAASLAGRIRNASIGCGARLKLATNMIWFSPDEGDHSALVDHLASRGILVGDSKPAMRIVIHRDIDDQDIDLAAAEFDTFYQARRSHRGGQAPGP